VLSLLINKSDIGVRPAPYFYARHVEKEPPPDGLPLPALFMLQKADIFFSVFSE